MTTTQPQFKPGDRFWTHYDYQWGTVESIASTDRGRIHGVTRSKLPDTTWYNVRYDDGRRSLLDDAHGDWDGTARASSHRRALRLRKGPEGIMTTDLSTKTIGQLAVIIDEDWTRVNYAAAPYLEAMFALDSINDRYFEDDGRGIVAYFLSNASTWHGPIARAVKAELKKRLNRAYAR